MEAQGRPVSLFSKGAVHESAHSTSGKPRLPEAFDAVHRRFSELTSVDFAVLIVSAAFAGKPQIARHRMVNSLLKEEFDPSVGLHALSLRLKTPEEWERETGVGQT